MKICGLILITLILGWSIALPTADGQQSSVDPEQRLQRLEAEVQQLKREVAELKAMLAQTAEGKPPATASLDQEALEFLQPLVGTPAQRQALLVTLRPTREDYQALFTSEFAEAAWSFYEPFWESDEISFSLRPDQNVIRLVKASVQDFQQATEAAREMPGGYKQVVPYLKGEYWIYSFKLTTQDSETGMSMTGLIKVNGHWRLFPKLWRVPIQQP